MRLGRGDRLVARADEARPEALDVQGRREGHRPEGLATLAPADECADAGLVPDVVEDRQRRRVDDRELLGRRRSEAGVETLDRRGPIGVPERRERLDQPDRGVRQEDGHARVGVVGDRPTDELQDDDPATAAGDERPAAHVEPATFDQRRIGAAQLGSAVEVGVEVLAAVLLLALDEEPDAAGELADRVEPRFHGPQPRQELALVVGRAAGVQPAVADLGLVRWSGPQLERDGRLDVVVLDHGDRPGALADLADDERRGIGHRQDLDVGAEGPQPFRGPVGRSLEGLAVALLGRESAELGELVGPAIDPLVDEGIEVGEVDAHLRTACAAGRGTAARSPAPSPGSADPRPTTRPRRWCRVARRRPAPRPGRASA